MLEVTPQQLVQKAKRAPSHPSPSLASWGVGAVVFEMRVGLMVETVEHFRFWYPPEKNSQRVANTPFVIDSRRVGMVLHELHSVCCWRSSSELLATREHASVSLFFKTASPKLTNTKS